MHGHIPHRNLPQLLLKAREELLRHFRPIITHFGLTEQQWRIIRALSENERLEPREICSICQILSPSLTGVLLRMEEMGLVVRRRMEEDQRRVIVRLTPKSEAIVKQMIPLIERQYQYLEDVFGTDLIARLYAVTDEALSVDSRLVQHVPLPPVLSES